MRISDTFPLPSPALQPEEVLFWDGLAVGELRVPWCTVCDAHVWRIRSHCTACYQPVTAWRTLAGTGEIYSYSIIHRADGAFADIGPYVLAWIALDGGPTILANVIAEDSDRIAIGAPVSLVSRAEPGSRVGPVFALS